MGDPRKQRKKYRNPSHPWESARIEQEKLLTNEYGLKNKKEIWKFSSKIKDINIQARNISASKTEQSKKEEKQLIDKLYKQGIIEKDAKIENILELNIRQLLDRRLQTILSKKGLASSIKQARQLITHNHIFINDKVINSPSYIVLRDEEDKITFKPTSSFANPEHPERTKKEKRIKISKEEIRDLEEKAKEIITDEEKFKESEQKAQEIIKDLQDKAIEKEKSHKEKLQKSEKPIELIENG